MCVLGEGKQLPGGGWSAVAGGGGRTDSTQGERIWSSLGRQKVNHGLLLIIHILWWGYSAASPQSAPIIEMTVWLLVAWCVGRWEHASIRQTLGASRSDCHRMIQDSRQVWLCSPYLILLQGACRWDCTHLIQVVSDWDCTQLIQCIRRWDCTCLFQVVGLYSTESRCKRVGLYSPNSSRKKVDHYSPDSKCK